MAFVITEPCIGCKDRSCVPVCPADCIHPGVLDSDGQVYDQLFIDPNRCICCGLCEAECPVDAIFEDDEVPVIWAHFAGLNADWYRRQEKAPLSANNNR